MVHSCHYLPHSPPVIGNTGTGLLTTSPSLLHSRATSASNSTTASEHRSWANLAQSITTCQQRRSATTADGDLLNRAGPLTGPWPRRALTESYSCHRHTTNSQPLIAYARTRRQRPLISGRKKRDGDRSTLCERATKSKLKRPRNELTGSGNTAKKNRQKNSSRYKEFTISIQKVKSVRTSTMKR